MSVHRFNRGRLALIRLMLLTGPFAHGCTTAQASESDLIQRMNAGGHVIMIRHARAPGTGDPANFQLRDCSTQRNLDDRGRAQARAIGDWLRSNGIQQARVFSSQWCRCLETAELMKFGPVTELPALNSFYQRPQDRKGNLSELQTFLSKQPLDGSLVVLVTHYVTIQGITGEPVSSGEGVLIKLERDQSHSVIGRVDFGLR
ncbi:MAG: histidine phosphatase family protein [Nitrospiraceae bacterium]